MTVKENRDIKRKLNVIKFASHQNFRVSYEN